MATRRKAPSSKPKATSRPSPTRVMRAQVAPHVRTLSNGQPRLKRRTM